MPVCKHCGSPARGNPCWYFDRTHYRFRRDPEMDDWQWESFKSNCDPPCMDDAYDEGQAELRGDNRRWLLGIIVLMTPICAFLWWLGR